ncbi:hypothetical protein K505DRAFT_230317 [Melanomma pulvis-pyrius CBS 109.77]|uniref:Xylanolytic transcriptional activator regulatory domain-containing protein n=1 Tax=Melanomma pulvis-pyrius CBS 109.77 TaxID=1314802 RepID=A0A6A6XTG0_9PLEO|nr:hypothetical protein K505DRAFT_230317 [Melanomma pulvis-pyrius CBS 109.77]
MKPSANTKQCDLKSPQCSNCDTAQVPCLIYNPAKQTENVYSMCLTIFLIPRNYVATLEAQIASLARENEKLRGQNLVLARSSEPTTVPSAQHEAGDTSPIDSPDWMSSSLGRIVCEPSNQPRFLGVSSGITLARLVMAAIRVEELPTVKQPLHQQQPTSYTPTARASLPPRHAANHLVEVYFQYQMPHLPIVERSQVEQAIENAYASVGEQQVYNRETSKDIFTAYIVFAIALCNVHHPSGERPPQSVDCFHSAIGEITNVFMYTKSHLETLKAVLLLCQYIALCPSKGSLWLLAGTALRLAIDLGLHWETEEHRLHLSLGLLNERRRLWFSTYLFDRMLCITLGRPFGISDHSTYVELPSPQITESRQNVHPFVAHTRRAHNHMIRIAQLESEIKHVLYSHFQGPSLAYPRANYAEWMRDIQPRLQEWRSTIPSPSDAHPSSIFASQAYWDVTYNNALLLLYRPNPIVSHPSPEALCISFDASSKIISGIKVLHRQRKIDIMWKWVHHLFMAGLTVIYGLWHSKEVRELSSVKDSIATVQSCSSTLSAFSERWFGAAGCRDAFELLSSATIEWLITTNSEQNFQSRKDFEEQLQSLQQQLPPLFAEGAGASDPMAILSTDGFGFGESLSETAQWPEFRDDEFWASGF